MKLLKLIQPLALALLAAGACGDSQPTSGGEAGSSAPFQTGAGPSEDIVKGAIQRSVEALATGSGTSHQSVEVNFESVNFGTARPLNAQDQIDGVRGSTLYPVRVKYSEHRVWGAGATRDLSTHYAYDFFRNEFGEWDYIGRGPVQ